MIQAKKRFGQNFLVDPRKLDSLVSGLNLSPGDLVLEVGPGTGNLTEQLLRNDIELIAVELDRDLLSPLEQKFKSGGKFRLIEGDIIKVNLREITSGRKVKIIGNLPYNISGAFVEWLIVYWDCLILALITVQKEVADRLKAGPGTRDYGALSVVAQSYFDIKKMFDIPPGCFTPRPKVNSTALLLSPSKKIDMEFRQFRDFLHAAFSQKRKKLVNSLVSGETGMYKEFSRGDLEKILGYLGKQTDIRAEQLSLTDLVTLFKMTLE